MNTATAEQMDALGRIKESGSEIASVETHIIEDESVLLGQLANKTFFEISENGQIEYSDY